MKRNNNRFKKQILLEKQQRDMRRSRRILLFALTIILAAFITGFWMLFTTAAQAMTNQERNIYDQCVYETRTPTRVGWNKNPRLAEQCYSQVMRNIQQRRVEDSYIRANNAYADYLEDNNHRHHGRRVRR